MTLLRSGRAFFLVLAVGVVRVPAGAEPMQKASTKAKAGPEAVPDPFRSMEGEGGAEEWIRVQNEKTRAYLHGKGKPGAEARLTELMSIGSVSGASVRAGRVFFLRRDGGQEQPVLVVRIDGQERVLVDPNRRSAEGKVALDWYLPSRTGKLVAFGLSRDGDEESELHLAQVESGALLPDRIPHTRAADIAWLPDDSGFYYTRYPKEGLYDRRVYLHHLGEDPRRDRLVFGEGRAKTDWPTVRLSADGSRVLLGVSIGWSRSELYLLDAARAGKARPRPLFAGPEAKLEDADWVEGAVYARTDLGAPRGRLVAIDPERPDPAHWRTVVPEGEAILEGFVHSGGRLFLHHLERGVSRLSVMPVRGGARREIPLPTAGSLAGMDADPVGGPLVFGFSSYFHPPAILSATKGGQEPEVVARVETGLDLSSYTLTQVEYPSYDGTLVPMILVHKKDLVRDRSHPTLLYGYGGFSVSLTPSFQRNVLFWLEHGGVYAVANLRGGAERGEEWHQAGKREKKFQVFADFEYAMRWLHHEGITCPARLAVMGGSNGGLLVGAAITRVPFLFRAAIGSVGLYDMVRYHKFPPAELWIDEYGDPDRPEDLKYLRAYSPYHQVVDGVAYPACYLNAAENDTRVHWVHTAKFAARLQQANTGAHPILFHLHRQEGHGAGKGKSDTIREYREKYAFLFSQLGME